MKLYYIGMAILHFGASVLFLVTATATDNAPLTIAAGSAWGLCALIWAYSAGTAA